MPYIELNFSHRFEGTIWNSALSDSNAVLVLEVRNSPARKTSFAAIDLQGGKILWQGVEFEEPWWISLDGVEGGVALFSMFTNDSNPDKKALIAYDISDQRILWWKNDFSLSAIGLKCVAGTNLQSDHLEQVFDLTTGGQATFTPKSIDDDVRRPVQFMEGHSYFSTVRTFLQLRFNFEAVASLEYMEHSSLIFISCYAKAGDGLRNELWVLSKEGDMLLRENLGDDLKGIGQDTFFIYGGSVIFVRKRGELFSYKIV